MTSLLSLSNLIAWSAQIVVLVAIALVTLHLLRLHAPAVRYVLLRTVLVVSLALPFVQPYSSANTLVAPALSVAFEPVESQPAIADRTRSQPGLLASVRWTTVLASAIGFGAAVRLAWMTIGVARLRRLRRAGETVTHSDEDTELMETIGAYPAVRSVCELGQPVTFGFRCPVILLPVSLRDQPPAIRRAVMAHELWHVKRRDWIWTVTEEIVRGLFWFNPAVWVLLSRIQAAREEVVDELTILTTGSRRSYADALLAFADARPLFAASAFARRKHLVRRMVLISKEAVMSGRRVVACGAVLAMTLMSAGWYAVQAFPLVVGVAAAQIVTDGPGPIEQRAKPVTPENPVPRRTSSVNPDYPSEAVESNARGVLTLRVVLDEAGRVAETRVTGFALRFFENIGINHNGITRENFETLMTRPTFCCMPDGRRESYGVFRGAIEALGRAATSAIAQWTYAPPADGPLAFSINIAFGERAAAMPPPPPPPPPAPQQLGGAATEAWSLSDGALRVGGNIKAPTKTRNVAPEYPAIAQAAGVQGVVVIEARIEGDGTVSATRVLRSIPLLDEAALAAVRQWQFTPTLLNGQPVPVIMTTTVNFTLQ